MGEPEERTADKLLSPHHLVPRISSVRTGHGHAARKVTGIPIPPRAELQEVRQAVRDGRGAREEARGRPRRAFSKDGQKTGTSVHKLAARIGRLLSEQVMLFNYGYLPKSGAGGHVPFQLAIDPHFDYSFRLVRAVMLTSDGIRPEVAELYQRFGKFRTALHRKHFQPFLAIGRLRYFYALGHTQILLVVKGLNPVLHVIEVDVLRAESGRRGQEVLRRLVQQQYSNVVVTIVRWLFFFA